MIATKVLLTGAAGKIGTILRPLLNERYQVTATDIVSFADSGCTRVVIGDLARPGFAEDATSDVDAVIHLAGRVGPDLGFEETLDGNYRSVLALLEACRRQGVGRFVFASSHHAIGMLPANGPYDVDSPAAPDGYYGLSKIFGEAACAMYSRRFGIKTLSIRIGNADATVADGRRERIWIGADDLLQLMEIGISGDGFDCAVVNGASICTAPLLSLKTADAIGYRPTKRSSEHLDTRFVPLDRIEKALVSRVGGFFAASALPPLGDDP